MKLAFCLIHYFPYGGMQRDFKRITEACLKNGHIIDVYVSTWEGEAIEGVNIRKLPSSRMTNHHRANAFSKKLSHALNNNDYDLVVGFNKLPGLDIYFAADGCFLEHMHYKNKLLRFTPRYVIYKKLEQTVFGKNSSTKILALSEMEMKNYMHHYKTSENRFTLLPPEVNSEQIMSINADNAREEICKQYNIDPQAILLLMIASRFKTKGLDRALNALSQLPTTKRQNMHMLVVGDDDPKPYRNEIERYGLETQITFVGGTRHVGSFLNAANILIHPAYRENTGLVLLEALVAGLPVLTTAQCGYATYITKAQAGIVLPAPFDQHQMNQCLLELLDPLYRKKLVESALTYRNQIKDLKMIPQVLNIIEGTSS